VDFIREATGAAPGVSQLAVQLSPRRFELPAVKVLAGGVPVEGEGWISGFKKMGLTWISLEPELIVKCRKNGFSLNFWQNGVGKMMIQE
jgi:hypothetical protein